MLITELGLRKFSKDGRLLEKRRQPARSYVQNFIEVLYAHMSQVHVTLTDALGRTGTFRYDRVLDMMAVSPPGWGKVADESMPADLLGIQAGSGLTAPTPDDTALETRYPHVGGAIEAADVMKEGFSYPPSTSALYLLTTRWGAQPLIVGQAVRAYGARIRAYREGSLAGMTLTASIRAVDASYNPTGPDIVSGTLALDDTITTDAAGQWLDITFTGQTTLLPALSGVTSRYYALVVRIDAGDGSNRLHWRYGGGSIATNRRYGDSYTTARWSADSGTSWTLISHYTFEFQIMGRYPQGLRYEGSGIRLLEEPAPPPSQRFTISRYFTNVCGQAMTINEIGLYIAMNHGTWGYCPILAMRDLVSPGVEVLDTELLEVTYIPQITV